MGLFSKKSKIEEAEEKAKEVKRKEMEKIKKLSRIELPSKGKVEKFKSTEYSQFLHEIETKPKTKYEIACSIAEKILPIKPSDEATYKLDDELKTAYINVTPQGAISLAYLVGLSLFAVALFFVVAGIDGTMAIMILLFAGIVTFYVYNYPDMKSKVMTMQMSSDTVLAILYMVIYMRTSPNLEGALRFSAQNLKGPLSWDLKKLLWDIEVGTYKTADEAIISYVFKWKEKNKEFSESLHLLRSVSVEPSRRNIIFDETINVILNGTRERSKHYAAGLRMPIMLIHAMGVLLPVMGLVLFPIVMIFMADVVKPMFVFFAYDIALPIALYFFTQYILQTKPPTFSQPDITLARDVPKLGYFRIGAKDYMILPIALAIGVPLFLFGFTGIGNSDVYTSVFYSLIIIFGISAAICIYCFLDAYQKIKIRNDIEKIEDEFAVALFQLGNVLSSGVPIELAIDKAKENLKGMKIAEMFDIAGMNMKKFGYTFEQAMFDKEVGAIWYYPSSLIQSVMQTIIESSKKSVKTAADSMIVISRYLKGMHDVKEEIEEILGETVSSMKFLAMFLAPMVAGITVTMAIVILQILTNLGASLGSIMATSTDVNMAQGILFVPWAMGGQPPISAPFFQMIVGIYMVEVAVLLAMFLNQIKYGEDAVGQRYLIWSVLIFAIIVYGVSWMVSYSMFGNQIATLLAPVT